MSIKNGFSAIRKRVPDPIIVMAVSLLLLLFLRYIVFSPIHRDVTTWDGFFQKWGAQLGVTYAIFVAVFIALFPSRFEKQVDGVRDKLEQELRFLEDRIRSPINNFREVVDKTEFLLKELGNRPNTQLMIVSASTVLGLELDDSKREEWRTLLTHRIEARCETSIVCLDPNGSPEGQSKLGEFCQVLAASPGVGVSYETLFDRGRKGIEDFYDLSSKYQNFKLKFGGDPPCQVIIARDEQGVSRSIFYLSSTSTLRRGDAPSGFYTEDSRMGHVLEIIFDYVSGSAVDAPKDPRIPEQRDRDYDLQVERAKRTEDYEWGCPQIAKGFKLLVKTGVFPPEIALAKNAFEVAIPEAVNLIWDGVPESDRTGIDVGTGTGFLALLLAKYCRSIIGIDIGAVAMANFRANFQRYQCVDSTRRFREVQGNLLESVQLTDVGKVPLIVFNHPYYPSPSNVFNVGGMLGGAASVRPFLQQARGYLKHGGGVLMPVADIAREDDPGSIARELGYHYVIQVGPDGNHDRYGKHKIYLFKPEK